MHALKPQLTLSKRTQCAPGALLLKVQGTLGCGCEWQSGCTWVDVNSEAGPLMASGNSSTVSMHTVTHIISTARQADPQHAVTDRKAKKVGQEVQARGHSGSLHWRNMILNTLSCSVLQQPRPRVRVLGLCVQAGSGRQNSEASVP